MINAASKLYDNLLIIYTTQYNNPSEDQNKRMIVLNRSGNLTFGFDENDLSPMPLLEANEKVRLEPEETIAEKGKLSPRNSPIMLAQIKAGNNSNKLKNEIKKILYLLYQHNKITKKNLQQFIQVIIIMEENMTVIRDPKTFYFDFAGPKDVDENLKHQIEFIIKSNESLAENKKNETEKILFKYKDENNIHEHRKQQNE